GVQSPEDGAEGTPVGQSFGTSFRSRHPILRPELSAVACSARYSLLDDRWLRLLPERTGRTYQRHSQDGAAATAHGYPAGKANGPRGHRYLQRGTTASGPEIQNARRSASSALR